MKLPPPKAFFMGKLPNLEEAAEMLASSSAITEEERHRTAWARGEVQDAENLLLDAWNSKSRRRMERGLLETNTEYSRIKVRFIGTDDPLALRNGKVYEAIVGQLGMLCIVDETGEEYGYPPSPELFEAVEG